MDVILGSIKGPWRVMCWGIKLKKKPSYKQIIREMNLKITEQRVHILDVLHSKKNHMTAQEVYEAVRAKDSSVGFATVYRFLKSLAQNQKVTEVRVGGLPARYELAVPDQHHDHLSCTSCGKIFEFKNADIEKQQIKVAMQFGFVLTGHVLELYGVCPDCQE